MTRKKQQTRESLLHVALRLFYEKGIYWTKIEDITERADIGKGTFYKYFPTKEALLLTLLQEGLKELTARIRERVRSSNDGSQITGQVIDAQFDFYLQRPEYLLLFHQVRGLLQLQAGHVKKLREVYHQHLKRLAQTLHPALKERDHDAAAAQDLSMVISAFTVGLLTYHLLFDKTDEVTRNRPRIQTQIEQSIQTLLQTEGALQTGLA
ncbi:MAG: TetR/AcrR family transcriptional regulator [Nitrospiraceae bacterium]